MLLRSIPILLLQQGVLPKHCFTSVVNKRYSKFLQGDWQHLFQAALDDLELQNNTRSDNSKNRAQDAGQPQCKPHLRLYPHVLQQARDLNYSRAMNLLRLPGLSGDSSGEIYIKLQAFHPSDSAPLQQPIPEFSVAMSAFTLINGKLIGKMIRRAK
jgi:hypothetical protein